MAGWVMELDTAGVQTVEVKFLHFNIKWILSNKTDKSEQDY
jgi:hypothetical protein